MRRAIVRPGLAVALGFLGLGLLAPAPARAAESELRPDQVARVVTELEIAIRGARERLLLLVSTPRAKGAMPLHDEPELRRLARELPRLEQELERWAHLETGPPPRTSR